MAKGEDLDKKKKHNFI